VVLRPYQLMKSLQKMISILCDMLFDGCLSEFQEFIRTHII